MTYAVFYERYKVDMHNTYTSSVCVPVVQFLQSSGDRDVCMLYVYMVNNTKYKSPDVIYVLVIAKMKVKWSSGFDSHRFFFSKNN